MEINKEVYLEVQVKVFVTFSVKSEGKCHHTYKSKSLYASKVSGRTLGIPPPLVLSSCLSKTLNLLASFAIAI